MKKLRIIALVLLVAMIPLSMFGCPKKVTATCTLEVVDDEGKVLYGPYNVTVEGTESNPPTALDAAQQAFLEYDIPFKVTNDGNSIASINGVDAAESSDGEYGYYSYWNLLIDGKESPEGRQSITRFYEGEKLQFVYTHGKTLRKDVVVTTNDTTDVD